jgi:anti-sigma B factor antagonist
VNDSARFDKLRPLTMSTSWPRAHVCLVQPAGEIDTTTAPVLGEYLREQTATAPSHLVLDLTAVRFLAAAGVTLIIDALRDDRGIHGRLHLLGVAENPPVERVLDLTGVLAVIPPHRDLEDALRRIDDLDQDD